MQINFTNDLERIAHKCNGLGENEAVWGKESEADGSHDSSMQDDEAPNPDYSRKH